MPPGPPRFRLLFALLAALALTPAGPAPAATKTTQLSDEMTTTRWAYAETRAPARLDPGEASAVVVRLHLETEDHQPEIYLALSKRVIAGQTWIRVRIPRRPNGTVGWVRRSALGAFHVVHTRLLVNRRTLRATLYRSGKRVWRSRIGVGKPSTPTPSGHFWVRERLRSLGAFYGPIAFGTSGYASISDWPGGGVVGVHGTSEPQLLPGRVSHGCVRLPNRAIRRLSRLMGLGTPVRIR